MRRRQKFAELARIAEEKKVKILGFLCDSCNKEFKTERGLMVHRGRVHGNTG